MWNPALEPVEDDGLIVAEAKEWAHEKHRLLSHYASVFAHAMRGKWDRLVYLDLFAGPGHFRLPGSGSAFLASPGVILNLDLPFTDYVFCELDSERADALARRIRARFSDKRTRVLNADTNVEAESVLRALPTPSRGNSVLSLCFLDPYNLGNLKFQTIRALATRYMDFLVLVPSGMDANRNPHNYISEGNLTLDEFLGTDTWRERWRNRERQNASFEQFVLAEFTRSMRTLNYLDPGLENMAPIRLPGKNVLLYRLALFSRNELGVRFWRETRKYTNPQTGFEF